MIYVIFFIFIKRLKLILMSSNACRFTYYARQAIWSSIFQWSVTRGTSNLLLRWCDLDVARCHKADVSLSGMVSGAHSGFSAT